MEQSRDEDLNVYQPKEVVLQGYNFGVRGMKGYKLEKYRIQEELHNAQSMDMDVQRLVRWRSVQETTPKVLPKCFT